MREFKVGDTVRCLNDSADNIKPGTILTISFIYRDDNLEFKGFDSILHPDEVEHCSRTIRDVVEGDIVYGDDDEDAKVIAVGETGLCIDYGWSGVWYTWDEAERDDIEIRQQVIQELTVAEISEKLGYEVKIVK